LNSANVTLLRPDIVPFRLPAETAVEQVAERLRESIIGGWLRRGQTLLVRGTARDVGAPVGIVREAFVRLCGDGYLMQTGRRTLVAPLCLEALHLLKRRLPLEVRLTRLATRRLTPFGLRLLHQIRREMVEAQHRLDLPTVQRSNYRFHNVLYRFADRPDLLAEVQALWAGFPFDLMTTMPSRMQAVAEEHTAVLAMLRVGDVRNAGEAMHYHILHGWQEFQRNYPLRLERQVRHARP
jgi:DNA-binding GntR family transcriptional regulator